MTRGESALRDAGWYEGRDVGAEAELAALRTVALVEPVVGGAVWTMFPAAARALREFHGLLLSPAGPGDDVAASGCAVDPTTARHALRPFADLGRSTGYRLFPFGRTDTGALLAVDEQGCLFSVDHGGRWQLGETVRQGLLALIEGRAPQRVAAKHWTWEAPAAGDTRPLGNTVRTALVAVYVLHHHRLFGARELRLTVTTLRGIGGAVLDDRAVPLPEGSLEESAAPLVAAMEKLIGAAGVTVRGAELKVTAAAPPNTPAPLSSVFCAVRTGHSAKTPGAVELSLSAGAGACVGQARTAVLACVEHLSRYAGRPTS
ncbi:SUKH-3 domain-containing protein [Streptomyces uncialis]|uniref:SUKH-3 domain-containing protein n=1 Tax=Streptomyces uncialis TaxID=1048205 RepID=UPI003863AAA9|nr:SUKH-3 domain-containing protein [Streptomyces uncialis]